MSSLHLYSAKGASQSVAAHSDGGQAPLQNEAFGLRAVRGMRPRLGCGEFVPEKLLFSRIRGQLSDRKGR